MPQFLISCGEKNEIEGFVVIILGEKKMASLTVKLIRFARKYKG